MWIVDDFLTSFEVFHDHVEFGVSIYLRWRVMNKYKRTRAIFQKVKFERNSCSTYIKLLLGPNWLHIRLKEDWRRIHRCFEKLKMVDLEHNNWITQLWKRKSRVDGIIYLRDNKIACSNGDIKVATLLSLRKVRRWQEFPRIGNLKWWSIEVG